MQGPETLYFFTDDNGQWWYVQNNLVLSSPSPLPLQYSPDGWEDIGILNQRNQKYFLMDRSFSVPLEFVEDGARILKYKFYNRGLGEKLHLVIAKQQLYFDATHYGFYYTLLYKGEIDFSEFSHEGPKVVLDIMEGGIVKFVKARENVKYPIPIDAPDTIKIKMDGINLRFGLSFLTIGIGVNNTTLYDVNRDITSNRQWLVTFYKISTEGNRLNVITNDVSKVVDNSIDYPNDERWFVKALAAIQLEAHFKFSGLLTKTMGNSSVDYLFKLVNQDGTTVHEFINESRAGFAAVNEALNIDQTFTINLNQDDRLFLVIHISVNATQPSQVGSIVLDESTSTFNYTSKYRTTYIKARRPFNVFQELAAKVADATVQSESTVLNTFDYFVLTSGDALRGLDGALIKTSLQDFYKSYNTIHSAGMGAILGKLKFEKKVNCIDYSSPIQLGECKGLKVSVDKDYCFSTIKIGCPEQDYDDVNGKQEFNNTHTYTTPNTSEGKELDLVSVYRFDCYGAEFTRLNFDGKTTTDSDSDNDVWVIAINPVPINDPVEGVVYELDRSLNPYATGLLEPATVFNLALSPKQCLFRNGPYIRSCFYKQDAEYLRFQTTEKNSSLEVAPPGGPVITENADVEIAKLGDRLFVPIKLTFDTRVPNDLLEQLAINPLSAYATSYVGIPLVGIPNKAGIHPEDNEAQSYELLASPQTDFTPLIDVFE